MIVLVRLAPCDVMRGGGGGDDQVTTTVTTHHHHISPNSQHLTSTDHRNETRERGEWAQTEIRGFSPTSQQKLWRFQFPFHVKEAREVYLVKI